MIQIETEQMRPISRASADIPGRPHVSTLIRWSARGIRGIRLETVIVGGRRFTSLEAIHRFLEALNATHAVAPTSITERRKRKNMEIDERLEIEGL